MSKVDIEQSEAWHEARLIPTAGIKGQEEQERRATSALLAVLRAVPEYTAALLSTIGGPKGKVASYVEVQLKDGEGKTHIPDGAIVVTRGKSRWTCLVEVKTGDAALSSEQVTRYLDMAKLHGYDCVLTISNAITARPEDLPYVIDGRRLRSMPVRHLSWWRILTEAVVQHRYRGISDPDQAWILSELIAYLDHEASGASGFTDMGAAWVRVRDAAHNGTLRAADPEARAVCERFEQFAEYLALGLSQDLGADVSVARGRKSTHADRVTAAVKLLADEGALACVMKVPDAVAPVNLRSDLRAKRVLCSVEVKAPEDGRPATRIAWLLRQLKDADGQLRVEVSFQGGRETTTALLSEARENPARLLSPVDPKRMPRLFVLEVARPLGTKRGRGKGSFVADTRHQLISFYRDVVQDLTAWQAKAPKLREVEADAEVELVATTEPPSFASELVRDPGEATEPEV